MFRNLKAEQARLGMSNNQVAEYLGISRTTYETKCRSGRFLVSEAVMLEKLFNCNFEYLFAMEKPAT